jgi:hypothetical protein
MQNVENIYKPIVARFKPARTDNLRPEIVPLIGEIFTWDYTGTSNDDEPYPGQQRWLTQDRRLNYWVPSEDLELLTEDSQDQLNE